MHVGRYWSELNVPIVAVRIKISERSYEYSEH